MHKVFGKEKLLFEICVCPHRCAVTIESSGIKEWASVGPDTILSDAQERVKNGDWAETRIALSVTVR